ncbi:flagellar hook protein FlgE [Rhodobacterales bacterium]|nr:flagellar hook protein FlgE [Rhodobacterales bacterium]
MGLFGVMRTGVSGMNAQASKLGTVADNIANSSTTGYKRAMTEFSSMVLSQGSGTYNSGGVQAHTKYAISNQGGMSYTTSKLDLGIAGNGFFVVSDGTDAGSTKALTRAGSFVPNGEGYLVNTAGYYLQGYPITNGAAPAVVANGLGGLEPININQTQLEATPTGQALLYTNVSEDAAVVPAANVPSTDFASAGTVQYSHKTSLITYDNLGNEVKLDIYYTKTSDGPPASDWEVSVFNSDDSTDGGFPYSAGPISSQAISFDTTNGKLTGTSATGVNVSIPNGGTFDIDISGSTFLNEDFTVTQVDTDGNPPSSVEGTEFDTDGTLYAVYANGDRRAIYKIPLADVPSPDKLDPASGNIYLPSFESGDVRVGFPGEAGLGKLEVMALESSNVDLASELTSMIESQRTYTANSQVFKAGSDLLQELVNLAR